jgi:hypothetical protein
MSRDAGNHMQLLERADLERLLRGLLGDAAFQAAHAEGGRLAIEEAAALLGTEEAPED